MCGITGFISLDNSIGESKLIEATNSLIHRGPDAEGIYFSDDRKVGFGHRRLSVIDISSAANQPMYSQSGRHVIVFNGEIYNFKQLREKLPGNGASLNTNSDTEVILELFERYGPDCFKWFNGMFALAIHDIQNNIVILYRDHIGIKPLFYYQDENNILFGSELKAIRKMHSKLEVNIEAIPYFLHLGFVPGPLTIYKSVKKFPSAHFIQIKISPSGINCLEKNFTKFWNIESSITSSPITDEKDARNKLTDLLFDSVEKQLVSDVPIGTFLSGGVDSSLVTAIASSVSNKKVNTFSMAIDDGKYNEGAYAGQVASHLQTIHHEFRVKEEQVLDLVNTLIPAFDEPFGDSSAFPTMMVSRMAREHVTVTLSGDGGDELFMGYGMYLWAKRLAHPLIPIIRWPLYKMSRLMSDRLKRAGNLFAYPLNENIITHIFSQEQYFFGESELEDLLVKPVFSFNELNAITPGNRKLDETEKQSLWDLNYYLKDDLLVKVDRSSMQYSLETRVPLLDHRLVEFAFNLHRDLKIRNGTMKYLLKSVLYDLVPKEIFQRPKWGFSIPLSRWLKSELRFLLDKYTSEDVIKKYNIVKYAQVNKIKNSYLQGSDHLFNRLWLVIVLHWWLEENQS